MNQPMVVVLTHEEAVYAASIGALRQINALLAGKRDRFGAYKKDGWGLNIEGAMGELAVAIALDLDQELTVDTYREGNDVGTYEVRTRSNHSWDLIVRQGDKDDAPYILVTGVFPEYRVHGWLYGRDAKKKKYQKDYGERPTAYFVPQSDLRPLADLPR